MTEHLGLGVILHMYLPRLCRATPVTGGIPSLTTRQISAVLVWTCCTTRTLCRSDLPKLVAKLVAFTGSLTQRRSRHGGQCCTWCQLQLAELAVKSEEKSLLTIKTGW